MSEWVTLRHAATGGEQRVTNHPDAIAAQEARGWAVVEDGEPEQVLAPTPAAGDEPGEWVDLVHPDLPGATNRVPNHPDALEGAFDAGWTYPEPPAEAVEEQLAQVHPRGGQATKAERKAAEQRAALAAAATDEPPAPGAGSNDQPAGDGQNEE